MVAPVRSIALHIEALTCRRACSAEARARMPVSAGVVSKPNLRPRPESSTLEVWSMADMDLPAPSEGFVLTHFLVVADQDRSRRWYEQVLGAKTVLERDPVIMKVANSWIILNVGGGPTEDKPDITLETPPDPQRTSAFLNIRVADIAAVYQQWRAVGAEFLTEPQDRGAEIRCYMRDPDGHLIEVGQSTGVRG